MNWIPLLKSRLKIPEVPENLISSEHVKSLYNKIYDKNTILIYAPAGYGKTTFLSSFFNSSKDHWHDICWFTLEQEDKEPQVFLAYLIEALFPADEPCWAETHKILSESIRSTLDMHFIMSVICQEMWSYFNSTDHLKKAIVFDDFHNVSGASDICSAVSFLNDNLPAGCTIFISSRYKTQIFTEKQKLSGKILEIDQRDLCFSENDIKEYLTNIPYINAAQPLAGKIEQSTEGWIAGITIICNALKDMDYETFLYQTRTLEHHTSLFNYFSTEVLKSIDENMMGFLIRASLLNGFTSEDIEKIFGLKAIPQAVDQCIEKGVFIQKVYDDNTVVYRFHSLFRDTLIKLQSNFLSSEIIKEYHIKAANYFMQKKYYSTAIDHLLKCGDITLINEVILRESITMDAFEDIHQLHLLFDLLPDNIVSENAILVFLKGLTYMHTRYNDSFKALNTAFEKSKKCGDFGMQLNIALAMVYACYSTNKMGEIRKIISQIQRPLELPGAKDMDLHIKTSIYLLDMISAVFDDRLKAAYLLYEKIDLNYMDQSLKWPYYVISCILNYRLGRIGSSAEIINGALHLEEISKSPILKAQANLSYSFPLMLKKDFSTLKPILSELLSFGEQHEFGYLLGNGKLIDAYIKYIEGNLEGSMESLDYAVLHFKQMNDHAMSEFCRLLKLFWMPLDIRSSKFIADAEKSLDIIKQQDAGYDIFEIGQCIFGVLLRIEGSYEPAEQVLLSAEAASRAHGSLLVNCGIHIHLAKLYFDIGDASKGAEYLRAAFETASSNKFYVFWDIHYPTLVEMASQALKLSIEADYALKLISEHFGPKNAEYLAERISLIDAADIEAVTTDFLSSPSINLSSLIPRIKVNLLGEFHIQVNNEVVSENIWKTKKIKGLLIYLLLNCGRSVSREALMEQFWPEADKKAASMSFRAALCELKRVLNKYKMIMSDGDVIIHETASGLKINKSENLIIDLNEFREYYHVIKSLPSNENNGSNKTRMLEKMLSIYKGDLLQFESYDDWVMIEREEAKSIFIDCAQMLVDEYIKKSDHQKLERTLFRILMFDPYNEQAACELIKFYLSKNQKSRAVNFYNTFKKRIKDELGIEMDSSCLPYNF